jgi:trk system potassium uptake protein
MKFCIIGLGTFGTQLARQLSREGHEIVAVDNDPLHVSQLKDEIEYLIQADCTDINAFHEIPIGACDAVILAIGEDFVTCRCRTC